MITTDRTGFVTHHHIIQAPCFSTWQLKAGKFSLYHVLIQMMTGQHEFARYHKGKSLVKADIIKVRNTFIRHARSKGDFPFEVLLSYSGEDDNNYSVLSRGAITEWDDAGNPISMAGCSLDITDFTTPKNIKIEPAFIPRLLKGIVIFFTVESVPLPRLYEFSM